MNISKATLEYFQEEFQTKQGKGRGCTQGWITLLESWFQKENRVSRCGLPQGGRHGGAGPEGRGQDAPSVRPQASREKPYRKGQEQPGNIPTLLVPKTKMLA